MTRRHGWMTHGWMTKALALSCALSTGACFAGNEPEAGAVGGTPGKLPGIGKPAIATLSAARDCPDLLEQIKRDVIRKIDAQAIRLKEGSDFNSGGYGRAEDGVSGPGFGTGGTAGAGAAPPVFGGAAGTGASSGSAGAGAPVDVDNGDAAGGSGTPPTGHSETNTQVEGVDEADIVKFDGESLYMVHGNTLFRLGAWPPASTSIDDQIAIEGSAVELFIADGKAVVFSSLYNQGDIQPLDDQKYAAEYSGDAYYGPYYGGAPFTKITTIDVSGTPKVEREVYVEGNYLSSRRHDSTVRAIIQGGFHAPPTFDAYIEYQDPWGEPYAQEDIDAQVDAWRDRIVASIEATKISDWIPVDRERKDGKIVEAEPRCVDYYVPPPALSSYGLTNVVSFDMTKPDGDLGGAIILGNADTVYANADSLVLAQRDYRYDSGFIQKEQTILHLFALDGAATSYRASGFVPGHVLNQFSLDVQGDTVRLATQQSIWQNFIELVPLENDLGEVPGAQARTQTDSRVLTLRAEGDELVRLAITPPLGEDGETIRSARFVGDRGYVTTARNVDPLTVVDMADAEDLRVLGELHIPGFSEYMHPIDADHLLTIGRNTNELGQDIGLRLQIFDVSDAANPVQSSVFDFQPGGYSEASNSHKAFTYWVPSGESAGLLAFPYVQYDYGFQSSLEVFRVSTTEGFEQLGVIDHTPLFGNCYDSAGYPANDYYAYTYCQQPEVRRGVFVQDASDIFVYSISYGGVLVHDLEDLDQAVGQAALPAPDFSEHRDYGSTPIGGTAGIGVPSDTAGVGAVAGVGGADPGVAGAGAEMDAGSAEPQPGTGGVSGGSAGIGGSAGGSAGTGG